MSTESSTLYIPQFDGKRYSSWRRKAVGYLTIKGVWSTICTKESLKKSTTEVEQDEKEAKALAYLQIIIKDEILDMFHQASASALWKALEERYQAQDAVTITLLQNKLRHLNLKEGGNLEEYLRELKLVFQELAGAGKIYNEVEQGKQLLSGLPQSYMPFLMTLSSLSSDELTIDWIERSLRSVEQ